MVFSGNPNSGNLGSDFKRLGIDFWAEVKKLDARNADRLKRLDELNNWRNAIAHQHFDPARLGGRTGLPPMFGHAERMLRGGVGELWPEVGATRSSPSVQPGRTSARGRVGAHGGGGSENGPMRRRTNAPPAASRVARPAPPGRYSRAIPA